MSEYDFISRLGELKEEYATKMGWNEDDPYWYENDAHLYDAECYAYEILEKDLKEERLNHYDYIMSNMLNDCFAGAKLVDKNGASFMVEYEGKRLNIEFDLAWAECVYTVNGKGPFSHSSYEHIGQDCRRVLSIEENDLEKLASKLNSFYKDFDHYGFIDCLDGDVTEEVLDEQLVEELNDPKGVASVLEELNDILENGEPDEEQVSELNELIDKVSAIQKTLDKSLEDKLASACERSEKTDTGVAGMDEICKE